jgi:hypothetical protein
MKNLDRDDWILIIGVFTTVTIATFSLGTITISYMNSNDNPYKKWQTYASCVQNNSELADQTIGKAVQFDCNTLLK